MIRSRYDSNKGKTENEIKKRVCSRQILTTRVSFPPKTLSVCHPAQIYLSCLVLLNVLNTSQKRCRFGRNTEYIPPFRMQPSSTNDNHRCHHCRRRCYQAKNGSIDKLKNQYYSDEMHVPSHYNLDLQRRYFRLDLPLDSFIILCCFC